ncbi:MULTISPECIES: hypothetical protein [Enterobacter]|uniref:hypothetical protein n=1 Tax=Enterobacter TaxID=547 RepID=UPI00223648F2|nr:hypothetical protein [Enterobacter mori]MCW4985706.1 hypothetical protein [Enterobacter mori]
MATKEEKYAEAYRRGILPADKKTRYEEAVRRGLMHNPELKALLEGVDLPDIEFPPKDTAAEVATKESARALVTAGANIADIVPEVGDAFVSAGAWALSKFGIGDGTYTPAARFKNYLPEYVKPQTTEGKMVAEILPYFVSPSTKAAQMPATASRLAKAGESLARIGSQSTVGALAQSGATDQSFTGLMAENVVFGGLLQGAGKMLGAGYKAYKGLPGETKEKIIRAELEGVTPEFAGDAQGILNVTRPALRGSEKSTEELAYAVNPSRDILDAARRLEIDELLIPSHYSTNTSYQAIEQGLKSVPGSQLDAQEKRAIEALAAKTDDLISEYGGATDKSELSKRFKGQQMIQIQKLGEKSDALFKQVDGAIPGKTLVGTRTIMDHLNERVSDLGGVEFLSDMERYLFKNMADTAMPTYARLSKVRQELGSAINKKQGPFKDMDAGELKLLYGKLSEDQQQVANFYGVGDLYRTGNELVGQRKVLEKNLENLLGKDLSGAITTKTGQGIRNLAKGDYKTLSQVLKRVPEGSRQEIILSGLNDAFIQGSRKEKQLNVPGFVDWFEGVKRNPEAMKLINENLPAGAIKRLDDIFEVSRGIRNAKSKEISTGRINSLLNQFDKEDGALAKIFGAAGKMTAATAAGAAGGPVASAAVSTALPLLGRAKDARTVATDKLLVSRDFRETTKQIAAGKAETPEQRQRLEALLERSDAFKQWKKTLSGNELQALTRQGFINWLTGEE